MTQQQTPADPQFESLLGFLKASRSFDFTGYKRSTLMRRVLKRMQVVGIDGFDVYRDYLELHGDEFEALFNTILINVTSFFRDPEAWDTLAREFIAPMLQRKQEGEPVRVWTAGCASGQETYTLMMLLAEAMGPEQFRERVKVYATDADNEALTAARHAVYDEAELEGLPEGFRERYFERTGGRWSFRGDLRRQVIFGRHDLVQDAPISHLDLLTCRNVLMYFNAEVQGRILARFHFALAPQGVLFLGKAEMMRSHTGLFTPAHLQARVFRKTPGSPRDRLLLLGRRSARQAPLPAPRQLTVREAALNVVPVAQLVVSPGGLLLLANDCARRLFGLEGGDVGRPLQDLKVSYHPLELRSRIEQVVTERCPVHLAGVEHAGAGDNEVRMYDVELAPLSDGGEEMMGVSVVFVDVTRHTRLQAEVELAHQSLETAFEELQSTNEELETTNEELQSTIEELETTNEELQSSNEELETMNEELQSTNEELETLNDELQRRTGALNDANAYLSSVLASLRSAVVVVDAEMRVQVWSPKMEELWGLRAGEVHGQPLLHLDIGLPLELLKAPLRAVLDGREAFQELPLDAVNRRGRGICCGVSVSPLRTAQGEIGGAVILVDEADEPARVAAPHAAG